MKYLIAFTWILSLMGAYFYGHEFGIGEGERLAKKNSGYKFNDTKFARFEK